MITFSQFPLSYTLVTCLAKNSLYIVLCRFFLLLDVLIDTSMITILTSLIECWSTILISSSDMTSWYRAIMGSWWRTSCLDQYIGIDVRLYLQCSLDNALGLCKPENIHYRKNQKGKKINSKVNTVNPYSYKPRIEWKVCTSVWEMNIDVTWNCLRTTWSHFNFQFWFELILFLYD